MHSFLSRGPQIFTNGFAQTARVAPKRPFECSHASKCGVVGRHGLQRLLPRTDGEVCYPSSERRLRRNPARLLLRRWASEMVARPSLWAAQSGQDRRDLPDRTTTREAGQCRRDMARRATTPSARSWREGGEQALGSTTGMVSDNRGHDRGCRTASSGDARCVGRPSVAGARRVKRSVISS